jgi:dolichyl-phosphate beta-glucosyltransferase
LQGLSPSIVSISIIVPVFNEEKRIDVCLQRLRSYCVNNNWDFEIIVVEDGSSDSTSKIVNWYHMLDSRISLLSLPLRLGKGGSIAAAALLSITKANMAYLDADLAADPSQLEVLLPHIVSHDIVIGSRILRSNLPRIKRPFHRELLSRLYSSIFRVLFRMPIYDPQCGIKLFRSSILPTLFRETTISGFAFDTDLIVTAYSLGMRIKEIPINWTHGKSSTLSVLTELRSMGLDLVSIWYNCHLKWRRGEVCYPQKKGSIYGKGLFIMLSQFQGVKTRPRKYLNYKNYVRELTLIERDTSYEAGPKSRVLGKTTGK